jgi:ATP-dependent DNA helicase RecG
MMDFMQLVNRQHFVNHYLKPLLETGKIAMTIPDKPKSRNQKYVKK